MGIVTRQRGTSFVIASDRGTGEARTRKPPKGKPSEIYEVWTGDAWSAEMTEAKSFDTLDDADDYIREHYDQVTSQG